MRFRTAAERRGALRAAGVLVLAGWLACLAPIDAPAPAPFGETGGATHEPGHRIDLNRATAGDLRRLPGIGPVLAERIVAHRRRHGPFERIDDLRAVRGIGPRLIERVRGSARVAVQPDSMLP